MKKFLSVILFFGCLFVSAQAPQKFYTRFGGYGHDIGYGVIQTFKGHYAVTGSTGSFGNGNSDVYLALVDSMGWVRWEKSYGGFNNDIGRSIIQLPDSGFVIAGYTNSYGAGGYDVFVVRTDKNGTLIWQKSYGGLDWDFGYAVKATLGGDSLMIVGSTYSFGYGKMDGYIIKTDLNGTFQWQKTYGGAEDDEFKSFVLTYNNQHAFAGTTKSMGDVKGDCWLVKTGLAGDSVFSYKYGNNNIQFLNDIKEHPITKDFYVCGGYDQVGFDSTSAILACFNENGTFQFQDIFTYHERKDEQFVSNAHFRNNEFAYLRKSNYTKVDLRLHTIVALFDNNIYIDATKYGAPEDDELFCISGTKNKGFIAVGYTTGFGAELTDVFLLKLDSTSLIGASSVIGINETQKEIDSFNVFPTLTQNEVTILSPGKEDMLVHVRDCRGKLLMEMNSYKEETKLSLGHLQDGMYFVTILLKNRSKTYKIFKSN